MWSAEARPNILVMASGIIFRVQKFERRLGVADPKNALKEHLLLPGLVFQKLLHVLRLPNGNAQDLHPLLGSTKRKTTASSFSTRSHWVQRHLYSTLGSCRGARGCGVANCSSTVVCNNRSSRHAEKMSSKNAITCSPASSSRGWLRGLYVVPRQTTLA